MKRCWAWAFLLLGLVLGHSADLEVQHARIIRTPAGTFLELDLTYPKGDDPLNLRVVMTDRSKGVLEQRVNDSWRQVREIPVPYGRSVFGLDTPYRIRLVGGRYRPGEQVPVTLLFPAGALITFTARVEAGPNPRPFLAIGAGALLLIGLSALVYRRQKAVRSPARPR